MNDNSNHNIFSINDSGFSMEALALFRYQYEHNVIYRQFCEVLHLRPHNVNTIADIPFLPISFFKSHQVQTTTFEPERVFESSGSTQAVTSKHVIKDISIYRQSFMRAFELFYGKPTDYCIVALLPAYLERQHSSLVMMTEELVRESGHPRSGFYLYDVENLHELLLQLESDGQKTLLIGVTFALLDFAEKYTMQLQHTIVMETGGMKGRREEQTRQEVHSLLQDRLGLQQIHSEYGMTELLSQAYSKGGGVFYCPPWMKVLLREEDDPRAIIVASDGKHSTGILNIIDLANRYSCAFIATDDIGRLYGDGSFEVLGRMDNSDIRGCSLLVV